MHKCFCLLIVDLLIKVGPSILLTFCYHFFPVSVLGTSGNDITVDSPLREKGTSSQSRTYIIISVVGGVVVLIFVGICAACWRALRSEKGRQSDSFDESATDANLNKNDLIKFHKNKGNSLVSLQTTTTTTVPLIHKYRNGSDSLWSKTFYQGLQHPSNPLSANGTSFEVFYML